MKKNKLKNYHSIDNVFAFKKDSIDNSRMIGEEIEPFYSEKPNLIHFIKESIFEVFHKNSNLERNDSF